MTVAVLCLLATLSVPRAQSQTYQVLYSFQGKPDGGGPFAGVIRDKQGNLYGTTKEGGDNYGIVFALSKTGTQTMRYSFSYGAYPMAGVVRDGMGNLYGTTEGGGAHQQGTVFKLSKAGTLTTLHSFCYGSGCSDGASPFAGLVRDGKGNLYGTTEYGGTNNKGAVFKVTPAGVESVLYNFCSQSLCADGEYPVAGLVQDSQGNLYGTTEDGGANGNGTIFKLTKARSESVLYSFQGTPDGFGPVAGLFRDAKGNLYGTTEGGGAYNHGSVFEFSSAGSETVLYSFCSQQPCNDGSQPMAGVIQDGKGNLYGTTYQGGSHNAGTIFKLSSTRAESVLYNFTNGTDGGFIVAGLIRDKQGNLYGTSPGGGTHSWGLVFKLKP